MPPSVSLEWRFSSRVLLPLFLVGAAAFLLVAGALLLATREADRIVWERQTQLVSHALAESFAKITHDQQSVSIWDESILHTRAVNDLDWLDANLGIWLHDYFGHDRAYVLDKNNRSIYAMVDGVQADPSSYTTAHTALSPLVRKLRLAMPEAAMEEAAAAHVLDLVMIEARPAIASIVPILSDTGTIVQEPGTEALHASIRFLDGSFLGALMRQHLLHGARFA